MKKGGIGGVSPHLTRGSGNTKNLVSTITFNPFYGLDSEEYSNASVDERERYLKSKCREAELVILTLSKMFSGEILNMEIKELNISVACILQVNAPLSDKEKGHILSISRHLIIS
jgi:hypothetical protein